MNISRQIYGTSKLLSKPKSTRLFGWFGFFFCDFTLVTCASHLRLRTGLASSNSRSTSSTAFNNFQSDLDKFENHAKYLYHVSFPHHPLLESLSDGLFSLKENKVKVSIVLFFEQWVIYLQDLINTLNRNQVSYIILCIASSISQFVQFFKKFFLLYFLIDQLKCFQ